MNDTHPDRSAVESLIAAMDGAVLARDMDALGDCYEEGVRVFEIARVFTGWAAQRASWEGCLPYFTGDVRADRRNVEIHVANGLATMSCVQRLSGLPEDPFGGWSHWYRVTLCMRRRGGSWRIYHEHVSVPYDHATSSAVELAPD